MAGMIEPWLPHAIKDLANHGFQQAFRVALSLIERNLVPDFVVRRGIIFLLSQRLKEVILGQKTKSLRCCMQHACTFASCAEPDRAQPGA